MEKMCMQCVVILTNGENVRLEIAVDKTSAIERCKQESQITGGRTKGGYVTGEQLLIAIKEFISRQ